MGASATFGEDSSAGETLIPRSIFVEDSINSNEVFWAILMNIKDIMKSSYQLHYFPILLF